MLTMILTGSNLMTGMSNGKQNARGLAIVMMIGASVLQRRKRMSLSEIYNKRPQETISDLDWKLPFGRYKNQTIEFVLELDPQWILWAAANTDLDFDYKILEQAEGARDDGFNQLLDGFNSKA